VGCPDRSRIPNPRQFAHFPLPCGKQEVHGFPFCNASLPVPLQTWQIPDPLQCEHFFEPSVMGFSSLSLFLPALFPGNEDNNMNFDFPAASDG
jgi:hypothetical protein